MDTKTRSRLEKLFRLAVDGAATLEERRTAALIFVDGLNKSGEVMQELEGLRNEAPELDLSQSRTFVAPFTLMCQSCGVSIVKGTEARLRGPFTFHVACYREG